MKNIFRLTILTLLIAMSCISSFALNTNIYDIHKVVDSEIVFVSDSGFTEAQKQNIISHFTGVKSDNNTMSVQSILCLFGHNLTTERIEYITHKYYSSVPRCLREIYDVSACSRCDYTSSTFVSSSRIGCCS